MEIQTMKDRKQKKEFIESLRKGQYYYLGWEQITLDLSSKVEGKVREGSPKRFVGSQGVIENGTYFFLGGVRIRSPKQCLWCFLTSGPFRKKTYSVLLEYYPPFFLHLPSFRDPHPRLSFSFLFLLFQVGTGD